VRVFNIDYQRLIGGVKGSCDANSTSHHPFYNFRFEIRVPKLDPTAMVEITVETIDRSDGLSKVVGFAFFPLFLNQAKKVPNTEQGAVGVIL
jgi:hypothetical protein